MNKLLEVKEFDIITGNPNFKNDEKYKYLDATVFHELVKFIHEFSKDEESADALDFMRISYKRNVGEIVTIKNYVGLIQMNNRYQVQVLPKISFDSVEDAGNKETKRIFLKMLKSMKDFPIKVFNDASLKVDHMNLYEIFINMYLQEVRQLVKQGIKSAYVGQEDNLKFYKGKLMTSQHIRINMVHKEKFYVSYDEFHPMQWSKVFLLNKSFTTFSGNNNSRALLFPMEKVYESYVAKYLKKILREVGWEVSSQDKGYYLFMEPRHKFALRPDIVCKRGNRIVIMDTKWKSLNNNESANYGISQSDMYQMYAYSKKYKTSEVWLLYPLNNEMRIHTDDIEFESGDGTTVRLHFVDLTCMPETLEKLRDKLEETEAYLV